MTQEKEIIDQVEKSIEQIGIEKTRLKIIDMLNQSLEIKKDLESRKIPIINVDSHIEMAYDILSYLRDKDRLNKINSILESSVLTFDQFTFKDLIDSYFLKNPNS
jgi:hypothetical protein